MNDRFLRLAGWYIALLAVVFVAWVLWGLAWSAHGASVTLAWDAPTNNTDGTPLTDLAGYKVYRGVAPSNYVNSTAYGLATKNEVPLPTLSRAWSGTNVTVVYAPTNWTLAWSNVTCGAAQVWHFAATALNSNGAESAYSADLRETQTLAVAWWGVRWGPSPLSLSSSVTGLTERVWSGPYAASLYVQAWARLTDGSDLDHPQIVGIIRPVPRPPTNLRQVLIP